MLKVFVIFTYLVFAFSDNTHALQNFTITNNNKVKAKISSEDINRIAVENDRIKNIFAKDNLNIRYDEDLGQIFVQPKSEYSDTKYNITIVTERGLVQDLQLAANAKEAETILLLDKRKQHKDIDKQMDGYQQKVMMLLRNVIRSERLDYFTVSNQNEKLIIWNDLEVLKTQIFSKDEVEISKFLVKNRSKEGIELHEVDFRLFPNIAAIAIQNRKLEPGEKTIVLMVQHADLS